MLFAYNYASDICTKNMVYLAEYCKSHFQNQFHIDYSRILTDISQVEENNLKMTSEAAPVYKNNDVICIQQSHNNRSCKKYIPHIIYLLHCCSLNSESSYKTPPNNSKKKHQIEGSDQNSISQACYIVEIYTILVRNPQNTNLLKQQTNLGACLHVPLPDD